MDSQKMWTTIREKNCHGIQLVTTQFFIMMFYAFLGKGLIIKREYVDYTTFNVLTVECVLNLFLFYCLQFDF